MAEKHNLEEILKLSKEDIKKYINSLAEDELDEFIDASKKYSAKQVDKIKYFKSLNNYQKGYDDTKGQN